MAFIYVSYFSSNTEGETGHISCGFNLANDINLLAPELFF